MNRLLVLLVVMTWCCEAPASDVARPIAVRDLGAAALPFGLPRARGGVLALDDKWQAGLAQRSSSRILHSAGWKVSGS